MLEQQLLRSGDRSSAAPSQPVYHERMKDVTTPEIRVWAMEVADMVENQDCLFPASPWQGDTRFRT
ncbi:MAG: hypothetical protein ACP5QO_04490 [Clostridia bacterium]